MNVIYVTLLSLLSLCLANCHHKTTKPKSRQKTQKIFVVKEAALKSSLYFSGVVAPLHTTTVTTPIEGFIHKKYYAFGEKIKKGSPLFVIDASASSKNYSKTLTAYLKAKDQFTIEKNKFSGTQQLWKDGPRLS